VAEALPGEPAVDIGMPAYRRPELIGAAIESVLAQSYSNWRLVVSENGPGGGEVEEAVRPYTADPRISYVATGANLGPAANWTRLLQAGRATYFTLIQDDDVWDSGFVASRVRFLERRPSCAFVFSGERMLDGHGREISVERTPKLPAADVSEILREGVYSPTEFVQSMYRHQLGGIHTPTISSGGVMSRRSALESVGAYFDDSLDFLYFDVELYTRMAFRFPSGFLRARDVAQRIHVSQDTCHDSISSESEFGGERWIRYHEYYGDWIRRELPDLKLPRQFDQLRARAYIWGALDAIERGEQRKGATFLRRAVRAYPPSLLNPRVTAAAVGTLLGERGRSALSRARDAARRRSAVVAYEQPNPGRG
jgi:glycosyltransferase involved in cell wall biosynthesis